MFFKPPFEKCLVTFVYYFLVFFASPEPWKMWFSHGGYCKNRGLAVPLPFLLLEGLLARFFFNFTCFLVLRNAAEKQRKKTRRLRPTREKGPPKKHSFLLSGSLPGAPWNAKCCQNLSKEHDFHDFLKNWKTLIFGDFGLSRPRLLGPEAPPGEAKNAPRPQK